jgi:hypothetical protein
MKRKLYIRPVHVGNSIFPISFAICSTNEQIDLDSEIITHFDLHCTGRQIKADCNDFFSANAEWGKPINTA